MWEAIAKNRFRSRALLLVMAVVMVALGYLIGMAVDPANGGLFGGLIAVGLWLIMTLVAMFQGDSILLSTVGAHEIQKEDAPQLWNVVEEMTIASGLGQMPKVYLIEDDAPNAFAAGRKPEKAVVAVTSGLLRRLNRDELQGVVAHEIGHINNQDIRFMTLAAVMLGTIVIISDIFLRSMFYSGRTRRRSSSSSKGGNQAQAIIMVAALVFAILAPILAHILYLACSRRREYLADASAARFTRYPEGLASALEKISRRGGGSSGKVKKASRIVAPMFTVNPRQAHASAGLFSTHPPTEKRVAVLRAMGGMVGYREYEEAFRQVEGKGKHLLGGRTLGEADSAPVREAAAEPEKKKTGEEQAREVTDLLGRIAGMLLLDCACGVNLKIPNGYTKPTIRCPRCGVTHEIPRARKAAAVPAETTSEEPATPQAMNRYERKSSGWESFQCSCGRNIQISPRFHAPAVKCPDCGTRIEIVPKVA